ncbi:TonB-dependent receptor [Sphaerotilus sp.]|uniref:TonB-dependent siderophore receptor n=1 Tax=Sphaerotilus sp. TaxID=2093942 RepID=UPI002ACDAC7E|nr:TonB-dependent receptor [Sphaerotilus sp.]MDZ7855838.1 TonB-dependent receptor [Sphaerotilus sp.]
MAIAAALLLATSAALAAPVAFDVPAQPLDRALALFARQAGLQLALPPALAAGLSSARVSGTREPAEALEELLRGSGLRGRIDGTALIVDQARATAMEDSTLPAVKVTATADRGRDGHAIEGYRVSDSAVAGFSTRPIKDSPFSVKVVPGELLVNRGVNEINELDKYDASVGNTSTTAGWFSAPTVRGFDLHNWSNYRYNGQTISNQVAMGLENKERVEILKGLSALQGGFSAPGGLLNYATKRPTDVTALHLHANQFGNFGVHADVGLKIDDTFGIRVNLAGEDERSHVDHVDGKRLFASLAADWRMGPQTLVQLDVEHERRNQHSTPAFSLDSNGKLPDVDPTTFLGQR